MANEINTGSNKLLERIITDAKADAQQIVQKSAEEANEILARGDQEMQRMQMDFDARAERAANEADERAKITARLDVRKYALEARRELLNEAFAQALERLCALCGAERERLIERRFMSEADGGEQVLPSEADRSLIKDILGRINEALSHQGKSALVLSDENFDARGGFLLRSQRYEKNCSFEAILHELRVAEESKVAEVLFE